MDFLQPGEAGLSESTWTDLHAEGDEISFSHVQPVTSMRSIRAKMYGKELNYEALQNIINDIVKANIPILNWAFITACGGDNLNIQEIIGLTKAMVGSGQSLSWNKKMVVDKHCVEVSRKQDNTHRSVYRSCLWTYQNVIKGHHIPGHCRLFGNHD
jgi:thymidine phosphorylase